jgi:FdhD protein
MKKTLPYHPQMTQAGRSPVHRATVVNHLGERREIWVPGEAPLTIKIDGQEIVTLMTLGTHPEELALGYLRNQRLVERVEEIASVAVDWEKEIALLRTTHGQGISDLKEKIAKMTVTTGCGQGTIFSCTLDKILEPRLPSLTVRQSHLYGLMKKASQMDTLYKQAGSVHGCGLCQEDRVLLFIEDVGRHNAADSISGRMWLDRISGGDKILYTTGRLTSEIVMKAAIMGIPALLSRSGVTQMGLELAQDLNMTIIARARGKRFQVFNGAEKVVFDARPVEEGS